jgi:hypothetical protein
VTAVAAQLADELPVGSVVRLQSVTDAISDSRVITSFASARSRRQSRYAVTVHRASEKQAALAALSRAAAPLFAEPDRHASPIAESIARAVLAGSATAGRHHIVVLSDARHVSRSPSLGKLDFECGSLPEVETFAAGLQSLAPAELWRATVVHFVNVQVEPVDGGRCASTLERYTAIRHLWLSSLRALDVRVTWSMEARVNSEGGWW